MRLRNRILILTILLFSMFILTGAAPLYIQSYEEGERAYEEEQYEESAEHFNDAMTDGGDPDVLQFNIGNAQYKMKDYEGAEASFHKALKEGRESSDEYYNIGNSLVMQAESAVDSDDVETGKELFSDAISAYSKALEHDFTDADTIHNLEHVKRRIEQLEEQQQQNQEQDKQEGEEEGESSEEDDSEPGDEGTDESSGGDEQEQSEESQGEDEQEQESGGEQQSDEQEQQEKDPWDDRPDPENDGLGMTDQEIDSLLDYYEHRERMDDNLQPWDQNWPQGIYDRSFGPPKFDEDDWIDW